MAGSGQRFYEDDEAEQILHRAASMSSPSTGMTYDRLLETAAELGIPPEAVEAAEREIVGNREEKMLRQEFDARQRQAFYSHLATFLIVNVGLVILNLATSREYLWCLWSFFGWGIGLVSHAMTSLNRQSTGYQDEFVKWKAVRESRLAIGEGPSTVTAQPSAFRVGVHVDLDRHDRHLQEKIERAKYRLERMERRRR